MLDHAIVVATRNRLAMLRCSLPLFLAQDRPATQVIVVDRSDDHDAVRAYCETLAADSAVPLHVEFGKEANLPSQRNQGLARVVEDVVVFPDDDSLWFPDTADRLLGAYEADHDRLYGAVSATEVYTPPGAAADDRPEAQKRLKDHPTVMRMRNRVEAAVVPQPFNVFGSERTRALAPRAASNGLSYPLAETIGGYLMSFRTEVVASLLFDEVLGSRIGYATHEDKDLGLRVLASGLLIAAAPEARVFHNVAPGARANGFDYGYFHLLNYMYACTKTFPPASRALRALPRYLRYKVLLYSLRRRDPYAREVHRGAVAALAELPTLTAAPPAELPGTYARICDRRG